jgi:molybdopterin-guanine dinucleotide biosynthesis protein A
MQQGHRRSLCADGLLLFGNDPPLEPEVRNETSAGLSGVILAGGQSRRMGRDKSQLVLGGETLIARMVRTLGTLCDDLVVVTNTPETLVGLNARLTGDVIPGGGALSGIHAGLVAARHEFAVVVACDMPFLNLALLRHMASLAPGYDAVVPLWQDQSEPLHAIYSRNCTAAIELILRRGGGRIAEFYERIHIRHLESAEIARFDPDGLSFFNVNSPEDWIRAQELAARSD